MLLRSVTNLGAVRYIGDRLRFVTACRPMGVDHLVGGDVVAEGEERPTLVPIRVERGEDRHTHLLGNVVRRCERQLCTPEAGTAVPDDQRSDGSENEVDRNPVAFDSGGKVRSEFVVP